MRINQYQSNFSVGEIDPLLRGRIDLQQYRNALEEATNVIIQPQGGIKRRDGLEFVYDFGSSFSSFKIIPFEYSVTDSYLLVFVVGRIYVFKDKELQKDISGTGNHYIAASAITEAMLDELEYTQAVDTLILCHEDLQTKRLVRNSDTSWTFENLPLTNPPKYAYAFDTHQPNYDVTPSAVSGNITITASNVTTDNGTAQAGSSNTITLKSATSYTSDDDPNGMFIKITSGTGSGQTRHVEDYVASTKVLTVYPAWDTAPDNTSQYEVKAFKEAAVDEYLQVDSTFGRARYVEYVSDTQMKAYVEIPFFDTDAIVAGEWTSEHGYEDVWSSTRGWPRSATFHEGRLYFGGSKSRPNTVWGSRVIDYFNFGVGTGLDDESVEATINTNQLNSIVNIVASNDLRIFTTGGEFIVVQSEDSPITPSSFLVRPQTRLGSKPGVPIEDLNGATIFVQRQGRAINGFQFGSDTNSYQVQNVSLLSSHLLNDPIDIAVRRSASTDEADRLFVVNGGDGSMAVYSILVGQNVIAPSKFTTSGEFVAVAVEVSSVFVIVKRTVDGSDVYNLEVFNPNRTLDSSKAGGALSKVEMQHLDEGDVGLIVDGVVQDGATVSSETYAADDDGLFTNKIYHAVPLPDLTLDGDFVTDGVAEFDGIARQLTFVFSGFVGWTYIPIQYITITGTDTYGFEITELLSMGTTSNPTLTSSTSFKTVTRINIPFSSHVGYLKVGVAATTINSVTFPSAATSFFETGLNYTVQAKTMPTEPALQSGTVHGVRKRIVQVDALVDKTKDLKINNRTITFDTEASSDAIAEFTGLKTAHGILGFDTTGQITISQTDPLPMTVLSLEYKMSVGN